MPEERNRCLAAGMLDHVAKPIDLDMLVAVIRRHVATEIEPLLTPPPVENPVVTATVDIADPVVDWVALSFVQRPEDLMEARRLIGGN